MKLKGNGGKCFELNIVGYQFSYSRWSFWIKPTELDDANWLMINIKVSGLKEFWEVTEPMLQTYDIKRLLEWLTQVMENREIEREIDFLEPNLRFIKVKKTDSNAHLRVFFELEARPKWVSNKGDLWIDLNPSKNELKEAIHDLQLQSKMFPVKKSLFCRSN